MLNRLSEIMRSPDLRYQRLKRQLRENFVYLLNDDITRNIAYDLVSDLATLEEQQCGNSANSISRRRSAVLVDIYLRDLEFARITRG